MNLLSVVLFFVGIGIGFILFEVARINYLKGLVGLFLVAVIGVVVIHFDNYYLYWLGLLAFLGIFPLMITQNKTAIHQKIICNAFMAFCVCVCLYGIFQE